MAIRSRPADQAPPPFTGFGRGVLGFFAELDAAQNRDWFEANKPRYEAESRGPMASLVASLGFALAARDHPLSGDPKRALFRIHRDVRFGHDKRPYKTNVSAVLTRDGDKKSQGLLYIDVGLSGCFAALGFYMPDPAQLAAIRERIMTAPARWAAVEAALAGAGLSLSQDAAAARLPRGIDPARASGLETVLRLKHFTISRPIGPDELVDPALVDGLADFAEAGRPLLEFGWSALADLPARRDHGRL
jgi:uncharacterized protein (TIGR02453 family)